MSTVMDALEDEYRKISAATLEVWDRNAGSGQAIGLPRGYYDYGISTGSFFEPGEQVRLVLDELRQLAAIDPGYVLIPEGSYHFTFLALAGHTFKSDDPLPPETPELKRICKELLNFGGWRLDGLRLLPGANFLLLVGIPTPELVEVRRAFARALRASGWARIIEARHEYKGYPFPPVIWHTTLCRYTSEFFPEAARSLFGRWRGRLLGNVELATPQLRKVNYDWSSTELIE